MTNTIPSVPAPVPSLRAVIAARGDVLSSGSHDDCEGACCALEAVALARLSRATDSPHELDMPDLRMLNGAAWSSDVVRTEHMLPVIEALFDYPSWDGARRVRFARTLALKNIQQVLPTVLDEIGFGDHAKACREATTLVAAVAAAADAATAAATAAARAADAAARAAYAAADAAARAAYAAYAAADAAARAAYAAARAADAAARAAYAAAADAILIVACKVWVESALESISA